MRLERHEILRLAQGLLAAPDSALDCQRAAEWLPAAVDAAAAGEDMAQVFPDLVAHLELCSACRHEFEDLLEVAKAAQSNSLPHPAEYPHFSVQQISRRAAADQSAPGREEFLTRLRRHLEQARTAVAGAGAAAVHGIAQAGQAAITLLVGPSGPAPQPLPVRSHASSEVQQQVYCVEPLGLKLTLKVREFERHRFTIRGLIEGEQLFEGVGVCLLAPESGEPLDCAQVDSTNTFSFHDVGPGCYQIRLDVTGSEAITLTGVDI